MKWENNRVRKAVSTDTDGESVKVAIVTDSNSGITQEEAKNLGIYVLPMPFMINGETYFEDIDLTQNQFYERLEGDDDVATSQPSPESVMNLWEEILKEYDQIVHIPMSSSLSGSCQSAMMFAQEYDGRIHVVDNKRISVTQRQSVLDALELSRNGMEAPQIKKILEEDQYNSSIYIMLDTLYYLKKGGRITAAAAALGTLLKLKPVLQIQGGKLDAFAKARTSNQGKTLMINAIKNDMIQRFGGIHKDKIRLFVVYAKNDTAALQLREELWQEFPGFEIQLAPISLSVACHIGPGCLAIACTQNLSV